MSFGHTLRWIYGLVMGTSTPWLKAKRPSRPEREIELGPNTSLFVGGTANGARSGRWTVNRSAIAFRATHQVATTPWLDSLIAMASPQTQAQSQVRTHEQLQDINGLSVSTFSAAANRAEWRWLFEKLKLTDTTLVAVDKPMHFDESVTGDGPIQLIPYMNAHTGADLVAILENHGVILCGALFSNKIHPLVDPKGPVSVSGWLLALDQIRQRAIELNQRLGRPATLLGEIGEPALFDIPSSTDPLNQFAQYLSDLSNPSFPFNEARTKYDWPELIGQTSLEENFDLLKTNRT